MKQVGYWLRSRAELALIYGCVYTARVIVPILRSKPSQWLIDRHTRSHPPDWLIMNGHSWFRDMCGTVGQTRVVTKPNEFLFKLSEGRRFTTQVQGMILCRTRPVWVSDKLFLQQLFDQVVAARPLYSYYDWHVGCDENGDLVVHQHAVHDNADPKPYRERAKAVRFNFGRRYTQEEFVGNCDPAVTVFPLRGTIDEPF